MNELFYTTDLDLAACLLTQGYQIVELSTQNIRRVEMGFDNSTDLRDSVNAYWTGRLEFEPQILFRNRRHIKARCQDACRNI